MVFGIIAAVIAVVASAGVYYQQKKMEAQARKQANEAKAVQVSGHDSNRGLYTVYGEALVGSTIVWKKVTDKEARITQSGFTTLSAATGSSLTTNKDHKNNRWLYRAVTLCNGPVTQVTNVTIDDEGYNSPRFTNRTTKHFATSISLGPEAGQNFSALRTAYSSTFGTWGSDATGKGVAYAMERLFLDKDKPAFQGEPQTKYKVKGRKLYDPRKDSTSSVYDSSLGTSSHRADTSSTWEWSDNPVLALLDYMRSEEYGRGLPLSVIDLASIATAADKCDVLVDVPQVLTNDTGSTVTYYDPETGEEYTTTINAAYPYYRANQTTTGTYANKQKRFRINIAIDPSKEILDNIQEILNVFRGNLSYANGKYLVHMADVQSSVLSLDDDDIIGGLKIANGDRSQRMNRATVKFINENKQHKTDQVSWPSLDSNEDGGLYDTYLAEDEDEKLHRTFTVKGCTDYYQAQDTAEFLVRESRSNLTVSGTFGSRCFGLVPGDVVSLDYDSAGFSGKYFRVIQSSIDLVSMNVQLQLKEYDSSVYTWNTNRGNEPLGLSWQEEVVNAAPTNLTIGSITTNTRTRADGSTAITLTIPFSDVPEGAQYVEVSWAINGTTEYNTQIVFDTENQTQTEVAVERDGETYAIRARYFATNSYGTLMPSDYATTTHAVADLSGTKLDGIEDGATQNTGALADLDTVDTDQIDNDAVTIAKLDTSLESTNYSAGVSGWKLTKAGVFEAGDGTFRGSISATSLSIAAGASVSGLDVSDVQNARYVDALFVRGTGANNNATQILRIGGSDVYNTTGRGLRLSVIKRSDHSVLSYRKDGTSSGNLDPNQRYDAYSSSNDQDQLDMRDALVELRTNGNGTRSAGEYGSDIIIVVTSYDANNLNTTNGGLLKTELKNNGATDRLNDFTGSNYRVPYLLVSVVGAGEGNGIEVMTGDTATDPYAEYFGTLVDGEIRGVIDALRDGVIINNGGVTMDKGGAIKTIGKSSESDSTNGFFLGYNGTSNKYTFGVGDASQSIQWSGTALTVTGNVTADEFTLSSGATLSDADDQIQNTNNNAFFRYETTAANDAVAAPTDTQFNTAFGRNPRTNDVVLVVNTASNPDVSAAYIYNGSSWDAKNDFLTGDLIVDGTIVANNLAANAVTAAKISVTSLDEISDNAGDITDGSVGGINIDSTKLYSGSTGTWQDTNTGFYLDNTGKFSLKDKLFFNPSDNTLTVKGVIDADSVIVQNTLEVIGNFADRSIADGTITRAMLDPDVFNDIYESLATSVGGSNGDFKTNSGSFTTSGGTVTVGTTSDKFDHGQQSVDVEAQFSHYFYSTTNYTTAQAQATLNFEVSADGSFTDLTSATKTHTLQFNEYDLSSYYGYTYLVYHLTGSVKKTFTSGSGNDLPDDTDLIFRVRVTGVGTAFTSQTVPFDLTANEGVTGVTSTGGNADTLDNLDSTAFLRSNVDDTFDANLTITGNLTVQGTQTSLEVATLQVEDRNIVLNYGSGDTSGSASGAGITIQDAVNSSTDATILWNTSASTFDFSHGITSAGILKLDTSPASNGVGDLKIIPTSNSASGVGYAGQVIGVNIENSINSSNEPEQDSTWGGVTGATAIAIQADDNSYGQFQVWTSPQSSTAGDALTPRFWIDGLGNATFSRGVTMGSSLVINPQDTSNEGGEIVLKAAGTNEDIHIDNHASLLRVFDGSTPTVRLSLNSSGDATFAGALTWSGGSSANANTAFAYGPNEYKVNPTDEDAQSGTWYESSSSSSWGSIKYGAGYAYSDTIGGYKQFNIPSGYDTAYMSFLTWNNGGYVDIHAVQADGDLVWTKRVNTYQNVENANHGNAQEHDGLITICVATGLDNFSAIRVTNKSGRVHLTGVAFTKEQLAGMGGNGIVHGAQIRGQINDATSISTGSVTIDEYLYHDGNTTTNLRFQTNRATLTSGGGAIVDAHDNGNLYLTGSTVQVYGNYSSTGTVTAGGLTVNKASESLANQPSHIATFDSTGTDGLALIRVTHDTASTAAALGAGIEFRTNDGSTGTAKKHGYIFLQGGQNTDLKYIAPYQHKFYVDGHDNDLTGTSYSDYGTLALEINDSGQAIFYNTVRSTNWFRGAGDHNTLYSDSATGTILQTPSNTNNAAGQLVIRDGLGVNHLTLDTYSNQVRLATGNVIRQGERQIYSGGSTSTQYLKIFDRGSSTAKADYMHFIVRAASYSEYTIEVKIHIPTYSGFSTSYGTMDAGQGVQVQITTAGLSAQTNAFNAIIETANLSSTSDQTELWLKITPPNSLTTLYVHDLADATTPFAGTTSGWTTTAPSNQHRTFYCVTSTTNINNAQYIYRDHTLYPALDLAISNANSSHGASNYFRGNTSHLVIGTGGTLYLNYGNSGGSIFSYGDQSHDGKFTVSHAVNSDYAAVVHNTTAHANNGYGLMAKTDHTGTSAYSLTAYTGSTIQFGVRGDGLIYSPNVYLNNPNVNSSGVGGLSILSGKRLGFDESGVRSWMQYASGGHFVIASGDGLGVVQAKQHYARNSVNIDSQDLLSTWATSIDTSNNYGTRVSSYYSYHNLGGAATSDGLQLAAYYGSGNTLYYRSGNDTVNQWDAWTRVHDEAWLPAAGLNYYKGNLSNPTLNWNNYANAAGQFGRIEIYDSAGFNTSGRHTNYPNDTIAGTSIVPYTYGTLEYSRGLYHMMQYWSSHYSSNGGGIWYRSGWNGSWFDWVRIWDSSNDSVLAKLPVANTFTAANTFSSTTTFNNTVTVNSSVSANEGIFGSSGGSNQGIYIDSGTGTGDYARIRHRESGTNRNTIHFFPRTWQSSTLAASATGSINLDGDYGVTFGAWNNIDGYVDGNGFHTGSGRGYYVGSTNIISSAGALTTGLTNFKILGANVSYESGNRNMKSGGIAAWNGYSTGANRPTTYDTALEVTGVGNSGFQLAISWISSTSTPLYIRSLRDCCQNWSSWNEVFTLGEDGSGSGYDADMVDGIHASSLLRSDAADTATGVITFDQATQLFRKNNATNYYTGSLMVESYGGATSIAAMGFHISGQVGRMLSMDSTGLLTWQDDFLASGNVTAYSDIRLKEDIQVISDPLQKMSAIRGVTYRRKDEGDERHMGVIAQELEAAGLTEVVREDRNGIKSVAYGNLVALCIESIKKQSELISRLEDRIAELEEKHGQD